MNLLSSAWFYWAVGVAVGLPLAIILLTELQHALIRRQSHLARQVSLLRNYLLPLGALLLLLVKANQVPAHDTSVRILTTVFGFLVLVLLVSGLNATVIQRAPEESWRKRLPVIFLDVARFILIGAGLAVIFSYVWGVRIGGLFTALGVTSVVIGLMLQNSVGQVVSGLFMLFEQPFRIGDWLDTPTVRGRIVEVNWRAVHIQTDSGLRITPNSVLAATPFTNLSRPPGAHKLAITTTFSTADPPDKVCALLSRIASALPQLKTGVMPTSVSVGGGQYCTTIGLNSAADDSPAHATFLRWLWYAARRERLHLDTADDKFSTTERVEDCLANGGGAGIAAESHRPALIGSVREDRPVWRRGDGRVRRSGARGNGVPGGRASAVDCDGRGRVDGAGRHARRGLISRVDGADASTQPGRRIRAGRGDRAGDRSRTPRTDRDE